MGHYPSSTSTKSFYHLGQMAKANSFQEYDYGKEGNLERYGQETPTNIDLSKFKDFDVPLAIFSGKNDELAVPIDCM